jgi:hypothetical protein
MVPLLLLKLLRTSKGTLNFLANWTEVWKAESGFPLWEIPVNDFLAGAQVPGRKARYLRLETKPETPEYFHLRQVQVYGKE